MTEYQDLKTIILAAGKSTRMKSDEPKALTLLKGKPFIQHILNTIKELDEKIKPVIVIGHKKESIKKVLGENHIYAVQKEQLGTGHAVMSAKSAINDEHKVALVISADQPLISKETLKIIINTQNNKNPTITIATAILPDFNEWRAGLNHFGRIIRGNDNLVKKIVEFKDANDEEKKIMEVNLALYAFDSKWLWDNITKIKNKNSQAEYYLTDLVKMACDQNKKVEAVQIDNIIEAIQPNSKEDLETLEKLLHS